jgi:hypothetical protein
MSSNLGKTVTNAYQCPEMINNLFGERRGEKHAK